MATKFEGVLERTTRLYKTTVKDQAGAVVPAASFTTLVLTLYSIHSGTIVNGRNAQNVLNANNVTVDTDGLLQWDVQPADNQILDATLNIEIHRALFEFTWASGAKAGKHEIDFHVRNLNKVT